MSDLTAAERRHNLIAKIVCLLLALILWIYVMQVENPDWEITLESVPVALTGTDEIRIDSDLSIYGGYQSTIDITLRGRKRDVESITAEDVSVTADVTTIKDVGEYELPLDVRVPHNVEIISESSETVRVLVDKNDRITVPVRVRMSGMMIGQEYSQGEPLLSLQEVTVTGPSRYLSEIDHADAVVPDLGRITTSQTVRCPISLINKSGGVVTNQYVTTSNLEATVTIPLYMKKQVPLTVGYSRSVYENSGARVTIEPSTIEIMGEVSIVENISRIEIATIDDSAMLQDTSFEAIFTLPDGVECPDGIEKATVNVTHTGSMTRDIWMNITEDNLTVKNPNGVTYMLMQPYVTFTVRGSNDDIRVLSEDKISFEIDLSSYSVEQSRTVKVPVKFKFDGCDSVFEIGNYYIDILINGSDQQI